MVLFVRSGTELVNPCGIQRGVNQSAQIFECVGINRATVDRYFTNTVSRVEGVGLAR